MFSSIIFRRLYLIFFAAAVAVRVVFVIAYEPVPVMWDARIYSSAALGLLHYAGQGGDFGHPEHFPAADSTEQKVQFETTMANYIKGEQIEWLYYARPTIAQAEEYIFIPGPIYPLYLAIIFLVSIGSTFLKVRLLNALIDGLCVVLLMRIAERLFDRKTAIVAGILYIFYLPFILLSGLISPDSMTILFILLCFHLILKGQDEQKNKYIYWTGFLLGILVLTRPTATLLAVPFGCGYIWDNRRDGQKVLINLLRGAGPFLLVTIPWITITSLYYGQPAIRDPNYSEANFRSSSSIKYEGYDLDYTEKDFWIYPVSYTIERDPLGYGRLLVKKFIRLWGQPYNDFKQTFILTPRLATWYHLLIIFPALFGMMLFIIDKKCGLIYLFLVPGYYTIVHIILHSLARYNLSAMPLVIIAGAAVWVKSFNYIRGLWLRKGGLAVLTTAAILIMSIVFVPERAYIELADVGPGIILSIALKFAAIFVIMVFLFKILSGEIKRPRVLKFLIIPFVVLAILVVESGSDRNNWVEWQCPLEKNNQTAGIKIYISRDFHLPEGLVARIGLDLKGVKGIADGIIMAVNGHRAEFALNAPPLDAFYYKKATYRVFEGLTGIGKDQMRYWSFVPLTAAEFNQAVDGDGFIDIKLTSAAVPGSCVELYGGYVTGAADSLLIPDLTHSSIERYVEKGDPRVLLNYHLSSDSSVSYYIEGNRESENDLSPLRGRQSGRYNIIIEAKKGDGTSVYF
jgi:4-amino-4-deoxy-L-arabinose transferase-like glycosyltransferase